MFYTGIGSRETPNRVCMLMSRFAQLQWRKPRSGGAIQADESQEVVPLELYLPRRGWRGKEGIWQYTHEQLLFADTIWKEAFPSDKAVRLGALVSMVGKRNWLCLRGGSEGPKAQRKGRS